jgi:hypothetical protein
LAESKTSGTFAVVKGNGYSTSWFGRTQCVANYIVLEFGIAQFLIFSGNHPEWQAGAFHACHSAQARRTAA